MKPEYALAKWFVEEIRGQDWYYPVHVKEMGSAKQLLSPGKDPAGNPIPAFTVEQVKAVAVALRDGCHLTEWLPLCSNANTLWLCDEYGAKGLWVVKRYIWQFYNDPPLPPAYWEQPMYDDWVVMFGPAALRRGEFCVYAGWSQKGPEKSGLHPDRLRELFGDEFVKLSLAQWRSVYGQL